MGHHVLCAGTLNIRHKNRSRTICVAADVWQTSMIAVRYQKEPLECITHKYIPNGG